MRKRRGRNRRNRRRQIRQIKLYRRSNLILLLTVFYILIFVAPVFIHQYQQVNVSRDIIISQGAMDAVTTFIQIFCLLFGLTILRIVWVVAWTLLCVLTALSDYMIATLHSNVSVDSVAAVLESTTSEIGSFLNFDMILTLFSGLFLGIFGVALMAREKKEPHNRRMSLLALMMAIGLITINQGGMSTRYAPYNFLTASYQYASQRYLSSPSDRKDISDIPAQWENTGATPLVIVVALGESARGDHFSINGYERETTPLLQKRAGLVNFRETSSCGVWTRISVPCILTRATESHKDPIFLETSLITVFKKLGFKTVWYAAQGKFSAADPVTVISAEADERIYLEEKQILDNTIKDEQLLPYLDKQLAGQKQPLLVVLHMYGSHWQYSARYTRPFERYKPVCAATLSRKYDEGDQLNEIRDCYTNKEALINSYDNSILYTDYVLDEIIRRLENKNALFMYTSDHGESLGEHGRFLHGHENAADNHIVPMFWWASEEFTKANAARWNALVRKSASPSSHDVIFHSLLDCAGVSSALIDPSLSLCHANGPVSPAAAGPDDDEDRAEFWYPDFEGPALYDDSGDMDAPEGASAGTPAAAQGPDAPGEDEDDDDSDDPRESLLTVDAPDEKDDTHESE